MTTDTKAVARFEFTPYGMTEALDGGYIRLHDHERVVMEFSAERLRWFERAGEYLKRAQAAEDALAASRAEVEGLKRDAERWNWIMQGHYRNEPARASRVIGACWSRKAMGDAIDNDIATQSAMEKGNV